MLRGILLSLALLVLATPIGAQDSIYAPEVTLRPGDLIRVAIWREKELSGEFPVDQHGAVVLPLLGERLVTDRPMEEVREALLDAYRTQLRNPAISITPLRRISVLGEVRMPNVYVVDPTVSLAGAVALAGGATPNGDMRKIRIVRDGQVISDQVSMQMSLEAVDIRSGDQIYIGERNWFARNSTYVISTAVSLGIFLTSVLLR